MRYARMAALTLAWLGLAAIGVYAGTLGGYQWGASAAAVIAQTGAAPGSGGTGNLVKRETVLGREAYVTYQFNSVGLSAVGIQWDEEIFALVKKALDAQYGQARCTNDKKGCTWTSQRSTIRLVETTSLGVTLLVFAQRT